MNEQYSTVLTSEFEGMKDRIAELEARWEKLEEVIRLIMSDEARTPSEKNAVMFVWWKMKALDREAPDGAECKDFRCPKCGSPYFGRDVVEGEDGKPIVLETVRCHGDSSGAKIYGKCDWRGVWPREAKDGGE